MTLVAFVGVGLAFVWWLARRRRTHPERPSRITRRWLHEHSYDREGDEP